MNIYKTSWQNSRKWNKITNNKVRKSYHYVIYSRGRNDNPLEKVTIRYNFTVYTKEIQIDPKREELYSLTHNNWNTNDNFSELLFYAYQNVQSPVNAAVGK